MTELLRAKERAYAPVVTALEPVLHNLPRKLVAIDGRLAAGKTSLGRYLAWCFNVALIETDFFLIPRQGRLVHRQCQLAGFLSHRLDREMPVIIEGVTVLRLLAAVKRKPNFVVYVTNTYEVDLEDDVGLRDDLAAYEAEFEPRLRANLLLELDHDG